MRITVIKRAARTADHPDMACHQHRCCRRPTSAAAASSATSLDYVLLAADNAHVMEGVTTMLRGAGAAVERHDLGLRMSARGANWKSALGHLSDGLAGFARRACASR